MPARQPVTLQIPPEIPQWVVAAVAGPWPQGDVDGMRRLGTAWIEVGDVLAEISKLTGAAREKALAAISGKTREALAEHGVNLDGDLRVAAETCYSLGDQL